MTPSRWPRIDGRWRVDTVATEAAGDDFGHIVRSRPVAVAEAASEGDVERVLRHARSSGLTVAPRGQGHGTYGQAQAPDGIVLDLRRLDRIHTVERHSITVEAGARWIDVALTTLKDGLLPPVLPDFLGLSVGGTLSVGGVSGMSFRWGAQVDRVTALVVATGAGDIVRCTADQDADLFHHVLAGLGQCAVILRTTFELVEAAPWVRVYRLTYPGVEAMVADLQRLAGTARFDYLLGIVTPTGDGRWEAQIEATGAVVDDDGDRFAGLVDVPGTRHVEDRPQEVWLRRVEEQVAALQALGMWTRPHPWLDLFVPAPEVGGLLGDILATAAIRGVGPLRILLYPIVRSRFGRPLLRLPGGELSFLVDVLCTAGPEPSAVEAMLAANRRLFERCRDRGGTLYPIGAIPLSAPDWRRHFGPEWERFVQAKRRLDPAGLLTPGPGIFR